jgi:hypothetical protein
VPDPDVAVTAGGSAPHAFATTVAAAAGCGGSGGAEYVHTNGSSAIAATAGYREQREHRAIV